MTETQEILFDAKAAEMVLRAHADAAGSTYTVIYDLKVAADHRLGRRQTEQEYWSYWDKVPIFQLEFFADSQELMIELAKERRDAGELVVNWCGDIKFSRSEDLDRWLARRESRLIEWRAYTARRELLEAPAAGEA